MKMFLAVCASVLLTSGLVLNAYMVKKQFYPMVIYITKSNSLMALIYAQVLGIVIILNKVIRQIFFGQLRPIEYEHLMERAWYAITETCLAFTAFRDDLSPKFVALFIILLFLRSFHWLAEDRVDVMERSPAISALFHIRILSLLFLLSILDTHFLLMAYYNTVSKGPSVQLVFGSEYAILLTVLFTITIKYVFHVMDLLVIRRDSPWENKAIGLMYVELLMSLIKVILYIIFMTIMIKVHNIPLFTVRPMYLSIRALRKAFNDVIMSRRAIRNMNSFYPVVTAQDLANSDNLCIICREEMVVNGSAKKLPCNHIFHVACLRSWFIRQQTCPTCRMNVLNINQTGQPNVVPAAQVVPPRQGEANQNVQLINLQPQQAQAVFGQINNFLNNLGRVLNQQRLQQQQQGAPPVPPTTPGSQQNQRSEEPLGTTSTQSLVNQFNNELARVLSSRLQISSTQSTQNLSSLTLEQLKQLEANERQAIEAQIGCLREIRSMIDLTIFKMEQYQKLIAATNTTTTTNNSNNSNNINQNETQSDTRNNGQEKSGESSIKSEEETIRQKRMNYLLSQKKQTEPEAGTSTSISS